MSHTLTARRITRHACDGECGRVGSWARNADRLYLCTECTARWIILSARETAEVNSPDSAN